MDSDGAPPDYRASPPSPPALASASPFSYFQEQNARDEHSTVAIIFDKAGFAKTDTVTGRIVLNLKSKIYLDTYQMQLSGTVTVSISSSKPHQSRVLKNRLLDRLPVELSSFESTMFRPGTHELPFAFDLPMGDPTDYPSNQLDILAVSGKRLEASIAYHLSVGFFTEDARYKGLSARDEALILSLDGEWEHRDDVPLFCAQAPLVLMETKSSRTTMPLIGAAFDSAALVAPASCCRTEGEPTIFNLRVANVPDTARAKSIRADLHIDNTNGEDEITGTVRLLRLVTVTEPDREPELLETLLFQTPFGPVAATAQLALGYEIPLMPEWSPFRLFEYKGERGPGPTELIDSKGKTTWAHGTFTVSCAYFIEVSPDGFPESARVRLSSTAKSSFF